MGSPDYEINVAEYLPDEAVIVIRRVVKNQIIGGAISEAGSEKRLAEALNISRSKINDLRNGRVPLKLGDLAKFCEYLDIELASVPIQGFSTRKGGRLNIKWQLEIGVELAWLLGIRLGDKDEDQYTVESELPMLKLHGSLLTAFVVSSNYRVMQFIVT
jgi:transcriptional regulator with XRE-family HTH domain